MGILTLDQNGEFYLNQEGRKYKRVTDCIKLVVPEFNANLIAQNIAKSQNEDDVDYSVLESDRNQLLEDWEKKSAIILSEFFYILSNRKTQISNGNTY